MPHKNPPLLTLGPLSNKVYIVTRYKREQNGVITSQEKFEVDDDWFDALVLDRANRRTQVIDDDGDVD
jgi:hypothetical protein